MQREIDTNASLANALPKKVGEYLRSLYFDTVCFEPDYLRMAADMVRPRTVCCWAVTRHFCSASRIR